MVMVKKKRQWWSAIIAGPECLCDSCRKIKKLQKLVVVDVKDQGALAFQDPETGKYYYPVEGFTATGDDLSDRFKEIEGE